MKKDFAMHRAEKFLPGCNYQVSDIIGKLLVRHPRVRTRAVIEVNKLTLGSTIIAIFLFRDYTRYLGVDAIPFV